jgi:UDP-glucose 4-epimerase
MKFLVTGGAGFIGSHLVDRLVRGNSSHVMVLDNFSRGREEHLAQSRQRIELFRGDIRDRVLLQSVMKDVDLVFHLAAQSNVLGAVKDLDYSFETNVVGTYEVLRAAQAAGAKRVIFSSSREVYGEPTSLPVCETATIAPKNAYGVSKATGEMYCRLFADKGMDVVILRLANVYGTRDHDRVIPLFAEQSFAGKGLTVFGRNKVLDFLWIGDLLDVLMKASDCLCPEGAVNVGSGRGVNLVDLAERISVLTGNGTKVQVTDERVPEVSRYVAEVGLAKKLFDLHCPEDALEHLPAVVNFVRSEMLAPAMKKESLNR